MRSSYLQSKAARWGTEAKEIVQKVPGTRTSCINYRGDSRSERFHLNPFPSDTELAAVAEVIGVTPDRLREMLAPEGRKMKCEPIRLCAACYQEEPCHRLEWQYQPTGGCVRDSVASANRHQLRLLSKCRNCQKKFPIPALWNDGCCDRCRLYFGEMTKWQKSY
jgi:hypothetical protein